MKGKTLIIKFLNDMAFLTDEVALNFDQVRISDNEISFPKPAFWSIYVQSFYEKDKRIVANVNSYNLGETEFSNEQIALSDKLNEIEKIDFTNIDTTGLLRTTINVKSKFKSTAFKQPVFNEIIVKKESIIRIFNSEFIVLIKDLKFINGGVYFKKYFPELKLHIDFHISNDFLIEEFDSVKNYFANILGTRRIKVLPYIKLIDSLVESKSAKSPDIDRIDESLIEEVKIDFVKSARENDSVSENQLFTMDELFETFLEKDFNATKIFESENHLVDFIVGNSKTKHFNHLRYLSSKHKSDILKLRIVHKPFSFVFLLSNTNDYYFIWETLDTKEATYIWKFDNDELKLIEYLKIINDKIGVINKEGKNYYINQKEDNFKRVYHDYLDLQNGFKNWKEEIDQLIFINS
jgi:hypothetical protein